MKILAYIFLMMVVCLSLSGCSSGEEPGKADMLTPLAHTWKATSVKLGGAEMAGYENLELTFSGTANAPVFTFGLVGRPETSPWPGEGLCSFGSNAETTIIRDAGTDHELSMTYVVNGDLLTIQFYFSGAGFNGRVSSVEGDWTFVFTRK